MTEQKQIKVSIVFNTDVWSVEATQAFFEQLREDYEDSGTVSNAIVTVEDITPVPVDAQVDGQSIGDPNRASF